MKVCDKRIGDLILDDIIRIRLQTLDVSKKVQLAIAVVEVAETAEHKFGFLERKTRRNFAEVVTLKWRKLIGIG
jgi:hypothetical protein